MLNAKREPLIFPVYCKSLVVLVVARSCLHFNFLEHVFYRERLSKETKPGGLAGVSALYTHMLSILTFSHLVTVDFRTMFAVTGFLF